MGAGSLAALAMQRVSATQPAPGGSIYGVSTLNPARRSEELSSIVRLDLTSGEVSYHELPEHRLGHSLLALPDGGYFAVPYGDDTTGCVFLDSNLKVLEVFNAPEGYGFGGHAAVLPDGKKIFGHFNKAGYQERRRANTDTGRNFVLDIESREIVATQETDIILGHDIIVTRDGRRVLIGDDSTLEHRSTEDLENATDSPFGLINHSPSIAVYDAMSFRHEKTLALDINGSFVHIEVDDEGSIFGAVEQYVGNTSAGHKALQELLGVDGDIERYVDSLADEFFDIELPYPGPLVRVDIETGEKFEQLAPQHQAPFDIKLNQKTGRVFNVFTDSNMLARYDPLRKRWGHFSTAAYGIDQPYGLADIPGTTYMVINGFMKGVAVFDTLTMATIATYPTENFGVKHLLYQA